MRMNMKSLEDFVSFAKLQDIVTKKDEEGKKLLWILAIIGAIATVVIIAVAVYKYLTPDAIEDYEDDFDDDFDDDFFDDEDDFEEVCEEVPAEEVVEETEE